MTKWGDDRRYLRPARDVEGQPLRTKSGKVVTEGDIEDWVAEAERGYDVELLREKENRLAVPVEGSLATMAHRPGDRPFDQGMVDLPGTTDVAKLREAVRWMAQTIHQAHHLESKGTFRECKKSVCLHAREILDGR